MGTKITGLANMSPEELKKHKRKVKGLAYKNKNKGSGEDGYTNRAGLTAVGMSIPGGIGKLKAKRKQRLEEATK